MAITKGIGNDLIEIARVRQSIDRHGQHFLDRVFSRKEQDYCYRFQDPNPHFAGKFAAKEAIAKALGTGFGSELSWLDIEIAHDERGKPLVFFSEPAQSRFDNPNVLVSISHSQEVAAAVALWV